MEEHFGYVADTVRTAQMRRAVSRLVSAGDHVLDLGCGSGVLGLLALRAGAGHVTLLDTTAAVHFAERVCTEAGYGDRVTVVQGLSSHVVLEHRADVILCDHVGYFGIDYGILGLLSDARARHLLPGGRILPSALELFLAPVFAPDAHKPIDALGHADVPAPLRALKKVAASSTWPVTLGPAAPASEPAKLCDLNLTEDTRSFFSWDRSFKVLGDGFVHGLAGWFRARLFDDIYMTNAPGGRNDAAMIDRSQAFLPLETPLSVVKDETLSVELAIRPDEHLLSWRVIQNRTGIAQQQTTLDGYLAGPHALARSHKDSPPVRNWTSDVTAAILELCDGKRSRAEITGLVTDRLGHSAPTQAALDDLITHVFAILTDGTVGHLPPHMTR